MRRQRHFEPAAERGAVNRRDDRLRRVFHRVERPLEAGRGRGLAEFGNVSAGDERPSVADDDDRLDRAVRLRRFDASFEALADDLRQRVHWRGVDRNQRDFAFDRKVDDRIYGGHGVFPLWRARSTPVMMARPGLLIGDDRNMIERPTASGQLPSKARPPGSKPNRLLGSSRFGREARLYGGSQRKSGLRRGRAKTQLFGTLCGAGRKARWGLPAV